MISQNQNKMKKIIYHLRSKPEYVRRHILHLSTVIGGFVLIFLWIYSLGTNLNNPETKSQTVNDLKPFSVLKDNLIGGYQSITEDQVDTQQ